MKAQFLINSSRVLNISARHPLDAISTKACSIAIASTVGAKLRRVVVAPTIGAMPRCEVVASTVGAKPRSVAFRLYCGDVDDTQLAYRITNPVITNVRNDIEIYPNPSSGKVTINCILEEGESAIVRIVDTMGKFVKSQELKAGNNKVSLSSAKFSNGLYNFIITTSNGRTFNNKILLNK